MTTQLFKLMTLSLVLLTGVFGEAQTLRVGPAISAGSGCPLGTVSTRFNSSNQNVSLSFKKFEVEGGGESTAVVSRKSCQVILPVSVPQGYSVALSQVQYQGHLDLEAGSRVQLRTEMFRAGSRGVVTQVQYRGRQNKDFSKTVRLNSQQLDWSPCGEDVNLRISSNLQLDVGAHQDSSSAKINRAWIVGLKIRACE